MVMHTALFGLIAAAMFAQKAGGKTKQNIFYRRALTGRVLAHELLQFSMDTVIMFLIVALYALYSRCP